MALSQNHTFLGGLVESAESSAGVTGAPVSDEFRNSVCRITTLFLERGHEYQNQRDKGIRPVSGFLARDGAGADPSQQPRAGIAPIQPQAAGQGKNYDPTKSVGLEGPVYRDMLKTAAPVIDHLLANANVDQAQAQNAAALERAATINNALESSRKMPDLIVRSVAVAARTLSPEGLETMRGELQKLVKMGNPKADLDEVNGAIDTVIEAAKNGVNPNTPGFENASASLKRYVSAALRSAETGSPGTVSTDAGRKGGAQQNLDRR
jgi:hypothetical protein